jgi:hypothetical protein
VVFISESPQKKVLILEENLEKKEINMQEE